jgi:hypothetical protein
MNSTAKVQITFEIKKQKQSKKNKQNIKPACPMA